jgi:hypothetical protein
LARQLPADGGFSRTHESGEGHDGDWRCASHAESLDERVLRRKAGEND